MPGSYAPGGLPPGGKEAVSVSVAIGVGCCLDLLAGRVERAPLLMQRVGLEWLFRLAQEPRRLLRRYVVDAAWLARITLATIQARLLPPTVLRGVPSRVHGGK